MREKKRHLIEVHVAGICFRETDHDIEVLIVKRTNERALYPGKWECGGGQMYPGENFKEAVTRQMKDELGVITSHAVMFDCYEILTPDLEQKKIPGIKFVCFIGGYVNGIGPQIDNSEHSEWKWESINNLNEIDFIPGIQRDIRVGWEFYVANKHIV